MKINHILLNICFVGFVVVVVLFFNCEDGKPKVYWTESTKLNPDAAELSRFSHMPSV